MGDFGSFISAFFQCMNMDITCFGITFSLWQVFVCSIVFSVCGFVIGKLFFSLLHARD